MIQPVRRRTYARELCLQFLYMYELQPESALEELEAFIAHHIKGVKDVEGRPIIADFTRHLSSGVIGDTNKIDKWAVSVAHNWPIERMALIDRNILRIAIFELLQEDSDAPPKVVINEAIELAKKFSSSKSGKFVNGILNQVMLRIQTEKENGIENPEPPEESLEKKIKSSKKKFNPHSNDNPFEIVEDKS